MAKRLIFVHGINNQDRTVDEIEDLWVSALRSALGAASDPWWDEVELRTAYYADVLFDAEQSLAAASDTVTPMSAASPSGDFVPDDVAAIYLEMQRAMGISDEVVRQHLAPGEADAPAERMGRGIHKRWLKAITRALENVIPGAAPGLARTFLSQAATYLHKPGVFDQINSLVEDQVFGSPENLESSVVVSHSLGTIVSYVVLRNIVGHHSLPLFVTLGSPLGIKMVRGRIGMPFIRPPVVKRWVNGSDREDFVALHAELNRTTFGPAEIINISNLDNGYDNPHDITKYLGQPSIAMEIGKALAG